MTRGRKGFIVARYPGVSREEAYRLHRKAYYAERGDMLTRQYALKTKFGMTLEQEKEMLIAQDHVCAICHKVPKNHKYFSVDHDHATGKVRGLLCSQCNTVLGMCGDNIQTLLTAVEYLKRNSKYVE